MDLKYIPKFTDEKMEARSLASSVQDDVILINSQQCIEDAEINKVGRVKEDKKHTYFESFLISQVKSCSQMCSKTHTSSSSGNKYL